MQNPMNILHNQISKLSSSVNWFISVTIKHPNILANDQIVIPILSPPWFTKLQSAQEIIPLVDCAATNAALIIE